MHHGNETALDLRKTKQTAAYLERLGPFFVGKAIWLSARRSPEVDAAEVAT